MNIAGSLRIGVAAIGCRALRRFGKDKSGNVATLFALAIIPAVGVVGFSIDYSRANALRARVNAAADMAALTAASEAVAGATASVAEVKAADIFKASLAGIKGLSYDSEETPTITVSNVNGIISSNVAFSGSVSTFFSAMLGRRSTPLNLQVAATGGSFVGAAGSGKYYGSGSLSQDPVIKGADGSVQIFSCDATGATWYNLLSDAGLQINANCAGNAVWSEYYKVSILAGAHTISIEPSLTSVGWYGTKQTGEAWTGAITIDGVAHAAQSGTNTYLTDSAAGITVKVVVGQPGVVGSSANYVLITTPSYSISVAYDSDDDIDFSTGLAATFALADIQIAANNAGKCGVPGGIWGGTLGSVDDINSSDFIVAGPTSQSSQFTWNCTTAAQANAKVRLVE